MIEDVEEVSTQLQTHRFIVRIQLKFALQRDIYSLVAAGPGGIAVEIPIHVLEIHDVGRLERIDCAERRGTGRSQKRRLRTMALSRSRSGTGGPIELCRPNRATSCSRCGEESHCSAGGQRPLQR